eukprot:TRINITY_DN1480_c0_g1_i12.p1 TRINITY_DN1480_c0_g1~~TRINITY_DN1480_c0_g1_i12.p1  ORF type:complete len:114 (-),score=19.77 TRINITY_DN1480_c0_g1_i12:46-387(-)
MASIDLYTTCNLLRYISEWDPREPAHTKGGYMDGEIRIPNVEGKLRMEIQTFPADDVDPLVKNIHPCLLHVVMIGKGKETRKWNRCPHITTGSRSFKLRMERYMLSIECQNWM